MQLVSLFISFIFCVFNAIVVLGQIRVLQPKLLVEKFGQDIIRGSTAAFGTPYWGEQLIGKLVYAESKGENYCNENDYTLPLEVSNDSNVSINTVQYPQIVLVKRGSCHFVTKVKVAQDYKNASAVIIIDSKHSEDSIDIKNVIMADDGWGNKVRIPSVLVSFEDGSRFIDVIEKGEEIIIEMVWDLPDDNIVHIDHWMTPAMSASVKFLHKFAPYAKQFKHHLNFKPHYWIFSLPSDFNSMCTASSGTFCGMVPDWKNSNITGKQIVEESVRQGCLWHVTKTVNDTVISSSGEYSEKWWDYIEQYKNRCLQPNTNGSKNGLTENCSYTLMEEIGIDINSVTKCVINLGETFLTTSLFNHAWSPTAMMLNNARFSGLLDPFIVARAICTGFTKEPEECDDLRLEAINHYLLKQEQNLNDIYGFNQGDLSNNTYIIPWWIYFIGTTGVLFLCGIVFLSYRQFLLQQLKNELRYEVFEEVKSQIGTLKEDEISKKMSHLGGSYTDSNNTLSKSDISSVGQLPLPFYINSVSSKETIIDMKT